MKDAWLNSFLGDSFSYDKISTLALNDLSNLVSQGSKVVDVSLTFEREAKIDTSRYRVSLAHERHSEGILEIAESAFLCSRFHLDSAIDKSIANKIKREWVANSLSGKRGKFVFVSTENDIPVGFLTTLEAEKVGVIDLIAVDVQHRNKGIGKSLLEAFLAWTHYDRYRVGTQAANISSCRLYEKMGFRLVNSQYVLHKHG